MKFAASDEYAPEELHRELARKLEALGDPQKTSPLVSSATALERTIQQLEAGWSKADGILGLPTGFTSLNRHTYGFCPSKLYTLVAPTGAGKTTLALNCAQAAVVDAGAVGLFISLEMDATELTVRSLATFSGIDADRIIRGEFRDDSEWLAFEKAKQILAKLPIEYVDGMDAITPSRCAP
jgi:replicative DNA helicase